MTSKLVVNTIEADTGISSVSFASSISMSSTSKFHFGAAGIDIGADTNINRPAAGVLGFNINSSEKVRIDSNGKVGIATDTGSGLINTRHAGTNQQVLHVRADLGSNNGRVLNIFTPDTDNTTAPFRFQTGNGYLFQCDTEDVFTIAHDRKIGIGTNAPSAKLEVQDRSGGTLIGLSVGTQYGNASFGGYNNYPAIMNSSSQPLIYCDTNNDRTEFFGDTVGFGTTCAFRVNGAERLRIGSSGQIGLGGENYGTSGQFLKSAGSGSAVVWANAGVTMADQWMLTSNFSLGGAVSIITSNWGRVSRAGYGSIGSAMTQSSGVFTYPQTGIYFVEYTAQLISTSAQRYLGGRIQTTHNNSSYAHAADVNTHCGLNNSYGTFMQITCSVIQDVQDVTQDKVRFCAVAFTPSDTTLQGDANRAATHVTFIRLGDT